MRKTEIERTIKFIFDCNDFQEMKEELKQITKDLTNNIIFYDVEGNKILPSEEAKERSLINLKIWEWFDKYFETEYIPCKKCLFLPNEER